MVEAVATEDELKSNIVDDVTILIGANINLTSAVNVNGVTGLVIEGNKFEIDGQKKDRCFYIISGSNVIFKNITMTNGYTVMNQDCIKLINQLPDVMSLPLRARLSWSPLVVASSQLVCKYIHFNSFHSITSSSSQSRPPLIKTHSLHQTLNLFVWYFLLRGRLFFAPPRH